MNSNKDLFIKAFIEAEETENAEYLNYEKHDIAFSQSFEKKMNKLIEKDKRMKISTRKSVKKIVLTAIVAVTAIVISLLTVSAVRSSDEPFFSFVKRIFPQYNDISLSDDSTPPVDKIEKEYTLTNLPDGYTLSEYQASELGVLVIWKNQKGDQIVFTQNTLSSGFAIDNEHDYRECFINGYKAYYAGNDYGVCLIWTDGYYRFKIAVPVSCKDIIMEFPKNISEKN